MSSSEVLYYTVFTLPLTEGGRMPCGLINAHQHSSPFIIIRLLSVQEEWYRVMVSKVGVAGATRCGLTSWPVWQGTTPPP